MTRQSVFEGCVRVLLREGIDGMTMDAVSREACVAKGTLYNYFDSKQAMLAYVQDHLFEPTRRRLAEIAREPVPGRVKLYWIAHHIVREFDRNRAIIQLTLAEFGPHPLAPRAAGDPKQQCLQDSLIQACADAFAATRLQGVCPALLARLFSGALLGLLQHRITMPAPGPCERDLRTLMLLFFPDTVRHGTAPQPAPLAAPRQTQE